MDSLRNDIRYAVRTLLRARGFTLAAVLTLALGIGANTTIFSAANAVLLRPFDAAAPDRLVRIYRGHHSPLDYSTFQRVRQEGTVFSAIYGKRSAMVGMRGAEANQRVFAQLVSGNYFAVLGIPAALGRTLTASEDSLPGANPVVVLSHSFWERRLGGDPGVVGQTLRLNNRVYTVIGVAREGFRGEEIGPEPELWVPLSESPALIGAPLSDEGGSLYVYARLKPNTTRAAADANLAVIARRVSESRPQEVEPIQLRTDFARGINAEVRTAAAGVSLMLMLVVGLVLLIACANIGNLFLARGVARRREIGVRQALGAGRMRLIRQLLTESVILALLGGVVAMVLTVWTADLLLAFLPPGAPVYLDLSPDIRVVAFAAIISIGAGLIFGVAPALRASAVDLVPALKDESSSYRRSRLRGAFVISQVMLCTVLLATTALFLRSLSNARRIDPGFDPSAILDLRVDLGLQQYSEERGRAFIDRLVESAQAMPGVRAVTTARIVPLGDTNMETSFVLDGQGTERRMTHFNVVGSSYFSTMGIPLVSGRDFTRNDDQNAPLVAVVNEVFAQRHWPDGNAIGKRFSLSGPEGPWTTVVGVARNGRYVSLGEEPRPFVYLAMLQNYSNEFFLQVRTAGGPTSIAQALLASAQALDPALPLEAPRPMHEDLEVALLPARFGAILLGTFGGLALLIAALGIYGVVSYAVAQRYREIGIRAALGASRAAVVRLVISEVGVLLAIGLGVGLALAVLAGKAVGGWLYGVGAADPVALLGAPGVLVGVALLASYLPARRAARLDPMLALRGE